MNKLLGMLGLAKRAGKVSTGTFICEKMIKSRMAQLVILAGDASENTKKAISDSCNFYGIKLIEYSNMDELGHYVGAKAPRAVVSVNDENFAKAICDIFSVSSEIEKG
ncbi:MAG: ribosomal L7Ae/L30e/S12e/Gadd45 family protein [Clostridia bacterium]|nr:ribosomal L7Ae/L30e/S12e/Gadd45 family protein [Clostridia bacterium]